MLINHHSKQFFVTVQVEFSAAHHIRGYEGDCSRPHGHNFKLVVEAGISKLNDIGLAVDFKALKKMAKDLIDRWDHQNLNEVPPFNDINPTAETLAFTAFEELARRIHIEIPDVQLRRVTVWENDRSAASFGIA